MTTTTCTWNVDWNQCANCARLKRRVDDAHTTLLAASERVDQAYDEYRDVRDAGHVAFGTPSHRAWQARLDNLEQQVDEASADSRAAIDEWGKSIRLHHRFHMAYTRIDAAGHVDTGETTTAQSYGDDAPCTCAMCQAEDGGSAETEEMVTARKDAAVDALVNIYGGHIDKWLEALRERTMAQPTEPTLQERAGYFTERDQCDPDDGAREKSREEARRGIADYMGVPPEDVHAAQYGMPVDASQYIPVAVVKSILTKWETHYTGFRDFLAGRGLNPDGAGCAIFAIKEIRDDINKLTTTEEAPNA